MLLQKSIAKFRDCKNTIQWHEIQQQLIWVQYFVSVLVVEYFLCCVSDSSKISEKSQMPTRWSSLVHFPEIRFVHYGCPLIPNCLASQGFIFHINIKPIINIVLCFKPSLKWKLSPWDLAMMCTIFSVH